MAYHAKNDTRRLIVFSRTVFDGFQRAYDHRGARTQYAHIRASLLEFFKISLFYPEFNDVCRSWFRKDAVFGSDKMLAYHSSQSMSSVLMLVDVI